MNLSGVSQSLQLREKGLEPLRLSAPDPKSGVYTNFTTLAMISIEYHVSQALSGASALKGQVTRYVSREGIEPSTRRLRVCCSAS